MLILSQSEKLVDNNQESLYNKYLNSVNCDSEKDSRRRGSAAQVHQKNFCISHTRNEVCGGMLVNSSFDGPDTGSIGSRVGIVALGNVEAVGLGIPGRRHKKRICKR